MSPRPAIGRLLFAAIVVAALVSMYRMGLLDPSVAGPAAASKTSPSLPAATMCKPITSAQVTRPISRLG